MIHYLLIYLYILCLLHNKLFINMLLLKRIMMKRQIKNKCPWRILLYSCEAQTQDPDKSELNFETKKNKSQNHLPTKYDETNLLG